MSISTFLDSSVLQLAITFSAPLLTAALGELILERSGILNVAIEGMMALAASVGFLVSYFSGSLFFGALAGIAASGVLGLIFAYFAVNLRANQIIVGLALLILGEGLSSLLYRLFVGVQLTSPQIPTLSRIAIPVLSEIPYIGPILFNQQILVYLAYLLVPVVAFVLYKTPLGLRLRACGENPRAVDTLGINVFRTRFLSTVVGSAIIGLGGVFLPMILTGSFTNGMVGGRGWLSLQLVIFGRWSPLYILFGSIFFAYIESMQFRMAMLTRAIPSQFFLMLPYVLAILVLVQAYRQAEAPESLLKPYHREQRI